MFKKAKVIMLPTTDKNAPILQGVFYSNHLVTKQSVVNDKEWLTFGKPQHLYITIDDEIKEGDWVLHLGNPIFQYNNTMKSFLCKDCKKIIATTDKSLLYEISSGEIYPEWDYKNLPQIPQSFIKEYCEKGGINEILVQYTNGDENSAPIVDLNNIIIKPTKTSWTKDEIISFILSDDFPFISPLDYVEKQGAIRMLNKSL